MTLARTAREAESDAEDAIAQRLDYRRRAVESAVGVVLAASVDGLLADAGRLRRELNGRTADSDEAGQAFQ